MDRLIVPVDLAQLSADERDVGGTQDVRDRVPALSSKAERLAGRERSVRELSVGSDQSHLSKPVREVRQRQRGLQSCDPRAHYHDAKRRSRSGSAQYVFALGSHGREFRRPGEAVIARPCDLFRGSSGHDAGDGDGTSPWRSVASLASATRELIPSFANTWRR
jgi:hypothetical protein